MGCIAKMQDRIIRAIFIDLAIIVTSEIKSPRNYTLKSSLASELNFRFF